MSPRTHWQVFPWFAGMLLLMMFLAACGAEPEKKKGSSQSTTTIATPTVSMSFPDSLSGGVAPSTSSAGRHLLADGSFACDFVGNGSDEPFDNGYHMSKFLVGIIATWQCITDNIMLNVSQLGALATGQIYTIGDSAGGSEPTALSITHDSATQTTVRLYYDFQTMTPSVFLSWNTAGDATTGKLVIFAAPMQSDPPATEDPSHMRMDFTSNGTQRTGDMYIYFQSHPTVTGFRIQVTENLDTTATPVFTALGRIETKAQWDTDYESANLSTPLPALAMYTVSDAAGVGAADALFTNIGWGVNFNLLMSGGAGHFGYYRYDKDDRYFFNAAGTSQWVNKIITTAVYDGGPSGGPRTNTNPTTGVIQSLFSLGGSYFTSSPNCSVAGESCLPFLQAVYSAAGGGWAGQEPNGGADPGDWRSTLMADIDGTDMLATVLPPGAADWDDVFVMTFTP